MYAAVGGFFPRRAARPTCEEEHIGFGQRALAITPGNFFRDDGAAVAAIDTANGVQQEDQNPHRGMNSNRRSAS